MSTIENNSPNQTNQIDISSESSERNSEMSSIIESQ